MRLKLDAKAQVFAPPREQIVQIDGNDSFLCFSSPRVFRMLWGSVVILVSQCSWYPVLNKSEVKMS